MPRRNSAKRKNARKNQTRSQRQHRRRRPTPLESAELIHRRQGGQLSLRPDRYSQLLGRLLGDEPSGQYLVTKSSLSPEEHAELQSLAAEAHHRFRGELEDAIAKLRQLLERGDPLRIAAMIQFFNLFGPWGSYYEPTHQGSEPKVELVCGLLVSQPSARDVDGPTTAEIQEIFTTVEAISELVFLVNVSRAAPGAGQADMLRYMGAMHWICMCGALRMALTARTSHDRFMSHMTIGSFVSTGSVSKIWSTSATLSRRL